MCFSIQSAIRYLVNQFKYSMLIECIKTPTMLRRQQFQDSGNNKTEPRVSEHKYH